jgi:hypothetical protein
VPRAGLAATDQLERVTGQEDSHWHSRDSTANRLEVVGLSGTSGERTAYDALVTGVASGSRSLSGPQQRILNSLSTWKQIGGRSPSNAQVAWLAGYSPSSTSYTNQRSALKTAGLLECPRPT